MQPSSSHLEVDFSVDNKVMCVFSQQHYIKYVPILHFVEHKTHLYCFFIEMVFVLSVSINISMLMWAWGRHSHTNTEFENVS